MLLFNAYLFGDTEVILALNLKFVIAGFRRLLDAVNSDGITKEAEGWNTLDRNKVAVKTSESAPTPWTFLILQRVKLG